MHFSGEKSPTGRRLLYPFSPLCQRNPRLFKRIISSPTRTEGSSSHKIKQGRPFGATDLGKCVPCNVHWNMLLCAYQLCSVFIFGVYCMCVDPRVLAADNILKVAFGENKAAPTWFKMPPLQANDLVKLTNTDAISHTKCGEYYCGFNDYEERDWQRAYNKRRERSEGLCRESRNLRCIH